MKNFFSSDIRSKKNKPSLDLPKIRRNPFIEIIPINVGCLNQCTYCKTKHARGQLGSWHPEEIIQRAQTVIQEGSCDSI
jgi:threonylcarbamoyladenosine tRNA methylthiotransferase CDKAL1